LLVGADPAPSPASIKWDKLWIPRIQMFKDSVDFWFGMFERGEVVLYTSDGNPDTMAVPHPQHPSLEGQLDAEGLSADGKTIIRYSPADGTTIAHITGSGSPVARATWRDTAKGRLAAR
jgi:hypothetical protein